MTEASARPPLAWYLAGVCSFSLPMGLQIVLFPWLIAVQLQQEPQWVGTAQFALMAPGFLFVLVGGLSADRFDARSLLMRLHLLAAIPPAVLAFSAASGALRYEVMIVYALAMGTVSAFVSPARDSALSRVADGAIGRVVTFAMAVTYGTQLLGFAVASAADHTGPAPLLLVQACTLALGAVAYSRLPRRSALAPRGGAIAEIVGGLREAAGSPRIAPALAIQAAAGLLFAGPYLVLVPLLVRDVYAGSSLEIALGMGCLMIGTLSGTLALARFGPVRRQGRALMLGLAIGAAAICVLSLSLPFALALAVMIVWGISGGVAMTLSRTIIQESAPESHRARVLSVFQLALMGGAPVGSFAIGFAIAAWGPALSMLFPGLGMLLVVAVTYFTSNLWRLEAPAPDDDGDQFSSVPKSVRS